MTPGHDRIGVLLLRLMVVPVRPARRYRVWVHDPSVLVGLAELLDVEIVWVMDFYDGPVDGLARVDGRECWFFAVADRQGSAVPSWPRVLVAHELTIEQARRAWIEHDLFTAFAAGRGDQEEWARAWDSRTDFSSTAAIGWFRDRSA